MSSHHFVREHQEPAVYIRSANILDLQVLGGLLEWAPWIIVHEEAIAAALEWGIRVDAVLCQLESKPMVEKLFAHLGKVDFLEASKPETDIVQIIDALKTKGGKDLNIFINNKAELEPYFNIPLPTSANIVLFSPNLKWVKITGKPFEKWFIKGRTIQIKDAPEMLEIEGDFNLIHPGLITILSDGLLKLRSKEKETWIGFAY